MPLESPLSNSSELETPTERTERLWRKLTEVEDGIEILREKRKKLGIHNVGMFNSGDLEELIKQEKVIRQEYRASKEVSKGGEQE